MAYTTKAVIQFTTHAARIYVDEQAHIHVFKTHGRYCDFDVFEDQILASDYIITPLPTSHYYIQFPGESLD